MLSGQIPDVGTIRESFFASSLKNSGLVINASQKGDFLVEDKFVFEIGGKDKGFEQIKKVMLIF